MADPVYNVAIEFAVGSFTDVTSDVNRFNVSRDLGTIYAPLTAGQAMIELANFNGKYSPSNAGSAYAGMMLPNKRVRVQATHSGSTYGLFLGWIKQWQLNPALGARMTVVHADDVVSRLDDIVVTTSLYSNINPASLFCTVMSQCAVNSFAADVVADSIDFAWFDNAAARKAIQRLVNFGRYGVFQDGGGTVQMKGRYFGAFDSAVNTIVNNFFGFDYALDDSKVINSVKVSGAPRQLTTSVSTIAWVIGAPSIPASGSIGFWLGYVDPVQPSVFTPANSVSATSSADYLCNTVSGGGGSDRTSTLSLSATFFGASAVCSFFNGSGDVVYLNKFQLRGFSAQLQPALSYSTNNSSSQAAYGHHDVQVSDDFMAKTLYLQPYADSLLLDRKEVAPAIRVELKNQFPDVLGIELGKVVSLVESLSGVGSQWIVQRVEHDVSLISGLEHTLVMDVEYAIDRPYLVLDDATRGALDSGRVLAF